MKVPKEAVTTASRAYAHPKKTAILAEILCGGANAVFFKSLQTVVQVH